MKFYISDLHFGHSNCISFDKHPFADRDEMDRVLIERWNQCVAPEDDVYILGDFAFHSRYAEEWYLKQLTGHKHLIIGNHDGRLLKNEKAMSYFDSAEQIMNVIDTLNGETVQVILCHYPIAEWPWKRRGAYHVYGHIHGDHDEAALYMSNCPKALNAGVMINEYKPCTLEELIRNNALFERKWIIDEVIEADRTFFETYSDEKLRKELDESINAIIRQSIASVEFNFNMNQEERDLIIFGIEADNLSYPDGLEYFSELSSDKLRKLVSLKYANENDKKNNAPSIREFLEFACRTSLKISFDGYAIDKERNDYRIAVEGVRVEFENCELSKEVGEAIEFLRHADEFKMDESGIYAWWD